MELSLEVDISPQLLALHLHLRDARPAMQEIADYRSAQFEAEIAGEVGPSGETLPPLSARYAQWKNRKFPGQPIRRLTGETVDSYRQTVSGNQITEEIRSRSAAYMQRGTPRMPARPYFPEELNDQDRRAIEAIVLRWMLLPLG